MLKEKCTVQIIIVQSELAEILGASSEFVELDFFGM
jgi:hypothetical protein